MARSSVAYVSQRGITSRSLHRYGQKYKPQIQSNNDIQKYMTTGKEMLETFDRAFVFYNKSDLGKHERPGPIVQGLFGVKRNGMSKICPFTFSNEKMLQKLRTLIRKQESAEAFGVSFVKCYLHYS